MGRGRGHARAARPRPRGRGAARAHPCAVPGHTDLPRSPQDGGVQVSGRTLPRPPHHPPLRQGQVRPEHALLRGCAYIHAPVRPHHRAGRKARGFCRSRGGQVGPRRRRPRRRCRRRSRCGSPPGRRPPPRSGAARSRPPPRRAPAGRPPPPGCWGRWGRCSCRAHPGHAARQPRHALHQPQHGRRRRPWPDARRRRRLLGRPRGRPPPAGARLDRV
mmetsp:Transcript_28751/g.70437  ORF Transcript_28751/g.70437 Transcript_28751/m.70437 type:complete len:217 (-) Transcript_28751:87-737(-)